MSVETGLSIKVYVRLLDEGTDVMRPVIATPTINGYFKLAMPDDYDADFENWEFKPGSTVQCNQQILEGRPELIAIAKID